MREPPAPSAADLALLDPDGSFVLRLKDDREALTRLASGLWAAEARGERLARLEALAHRLAGAAGTFGYARVGDAALALENGIMSAGHGVDRGEDRSMIERDLAALQNALDISLEKR